MFNLDRDDTVGIWIEYPDEPDEQYKIRPLTPDGFQHFRTISTKKVRDRAGQYVDKPDEDRYRELLWDHLLEEWKGVMAGTTPVPCTLENKLKLAGMSSARANWIVETADRLANSDTDREELAKKNLMPGSGIASTTLTSAA